MKKLFSLKKCLLMVIAIFAIMFSIVIGLHSRNEHRLKEFLDSRTPVPLNAVEFPAKGVILNDKITLDYLSKALADSIKYGSSSSHSFGPTCSVVFVLGDGENIQTSLDLFRANDGFTILGPYDSEFKDSIPYEVKLQANMPPELSRAFARLNN